MEGLSGAPVFVHQVVDLVIPSLEKVPDVLDVVMHYPKAIGIVKLLGLYTGSWDGEPGTILEADRNFRGGMRVPVGMGTVVPTKKIIELLQDHPELKKFRKEWIDAHESEHAAGQIASPGEMAPGYG